MNYQQSREKAESFIAALQRVENDEPASLEQIVELFAESAELTNPAIEREGDARKGREQIARFWENYKASFQEIRSEFFKVTANENSAGLFWRSTGSHVSGDPLSYEGVSLLDFDEQGKIVRFKGFYDSQEVAIKITS